MSNVARPYWDPPGPANANQPVRRSRTLRGYADAVTITSPQAAHLNAPLPAAAPPSPSPLETFLSKLGSCTRQGRHASWNTETDEEVEEPLFGGFVITLIRITSHQPTTLLHFSLCLPALTFQRTSPAPQTEAASECRCSPWPALDPTFDPAYAFVSSPLLAPSALAAVRLLLVLYALCIYAALVLDAAAGSGRSFSFFTQLSYIGVAAYLVAAGVQTAGSARWGRTGYWYRGWGRGMQAAHVLLQSTVVVFPFIVTVVFWVLLSSDTFSTTFSGTVLAFALLELLTHAPPAPLLTLPVQILFVGACLYYKGEPGVLPCVVSFAFPAFLSLYVGGTAAPLFPSSASLQPPPSFPVVCGTVVAGREASEALGPTSYPCRRRCVQGVRPPGALWPPVSSRRAYGANSALIPIPSSLHAPAFSFCCFFSSLPPRASFLFSLPLRRSTLRSFVHACPLIAHARSSHRTAHPFLNPSTQHARLAAYIIGITLGDVVMLFFHALHHLITHPPHSRKREGGARGGRRWERVEREANEGLEEWEEVERPVNGVGPTKKEGRVGREEAGAEP
ncbi:hypothetical protein FB451DRAFT_1570496 [Mycena latifolia]|nr:hypothetical protein FB451DRAFT_1570496 [Mycena latifolia]